MGHKEKRQQTILKDKKTFQVDRLYFHHTQFNLKKLIEIKLLFAKRLVPGEMIPSLLITMAMNTKGDVLKRPSLYFESSFISLLARDKFNCLIDLTQLQGSTSGLQTPSLETLLKTQTLVMDNGRWSSTKV